MEKIRINSIVYKRQIVGFCLKNVPDKVGMLSKCLNILKDHKINLEIIVQLPSENKKVAEIFLTSKSRPNSKKINNIKESKFYLDNQISALCIENIAKVEISGVGLTRTHEFIHKIYKTLSDAEVNIHAQVCSDINIIFVIYQNDEAKTVEALSSICKDIRIVDPEKIVSYS